MAVEITSGDLKYKVLFKQPVSSLNDEGGTELDYDTPATEIETWAAISRVTTGRTTDAATDVMVDQFEFWIRASVQRQTITKDWIIEYGGLDHTITELDGYSQLGFIRIIARVRTDG